MLAVDGEKKAHVWESWGWREYHRLRTWQERVAGIQSWERHRERRQKRRVKPSHGLKAMLRNFSSVQMVLKSLQQKNNMIRLASKKKKNESSTSKNKNGLEGKGHTWGNQLVSQTNPDQSWRYICRKWRDMERYTDLSYPISGLSPIACPGWLRESQLSLSVSVFLFKGKMGTTPSLPNLYGNQMDINIG